MDEALDNLHQCERKLMIAALRSIQEDLEAAYKDAAWPAVFDCLASLGKVIEGYAGDPESGRGEGNNG